jgi:hypothetical protein|nr:MAG TPA: hypothetical protein [Caudoviricetes sp.]
MKAGATYNLIVKLPEITDEPSEQEIIDEIIFTINCGSVQLSKVYPSDVSLAGDVYIIPLNQAETKQLVGNCQLEAQVNYTNKAVQKSYIQSFTVSDTLATKDVDGVPDAIHNSELILRLIGSSVLVISIVPEVADEIIKNMNKLYLATKQAMEDTQSYGEQTKSDLQLKLQDALGSINDVAIGQLESINNTALAQIDVINGAGRANIRSVNGVGSQNINNLNNAYTENLEKFNDNADNVYNAKVVAFNEVTSSKLTDINNTATSQIRAINNTALTQINAINKTSQSQVQNMTVKYSDMCRTLGIEHEGILCLRNLKRVSINVASFKYIKFGKMYIDSTDKKLISNQGPYLFNVDNFGYINTDEEYDISSEKELYCQSEYYHDPTITVYVEYKLYNESEETTEE